MKCPACARALPDDGGACLSCGALPRLPVDGALAQDPAPRREPTGKRRRERERERHWKDEVRERIDRRRQRVTPGEAPDLPLFRQPEAVAPAAPPARRPTVPALAPHAARGPEPEPEPPMPAPSGPTELGGEPDTPRVPADGELLLRPVSEPISAEGSQPLRLHAVEPGPPPPASVEPPEDEAPARGADDWTLGEPQREPTAALVDRPALPAERLQAALVDLGVLAGLWAGILYGAGRAAHVPLGGLQPAWPWLVGYMALLGLLYAAYFTGTTGQTLGKMLFGLRVVTRGGGIPGYPEALGRALLGSFGAGLAGLGLAPMLFDPARRALHDRVFGTRVVRPGPPTARLS